MSVEDLLAREVVTGFEGTLVRDLLRAEARHRGVELEVVVEVGHRESALHLVVAGAGCAVLPQPLAHLAELKGAVICSMEPVLTRQISVLQRPGRLSPAAEEFQRLLLHQQR